MSQREFSPQDVIRDSQQVIEALESEIVTTSKPVVATVSKVRVEAMHLELSLEARSGDISDLLNNAMAWWGVGQYASVVSSDPDQLKVVCRLVVGSIPVTGTLIRFYPPKYLSRLQEFWEDSRRSNAALRVQDALRSSKDELDTGSSSHSNLFPTLRDKQHDALKLASKEISFLWGPPGTGKTFTLGALIATLLLEQPETRILLIATTNRAVDGAIISVDERLASLKRKKLGSEKIQKRIKRYGSNFDAARYEKESRQYLIADPHRESVIAKIAQLEHEEPHKLDLIEYSKWKERLNLLRSQIPKPDMSAPLLAMTATAAIYVISELEKRPFDLVVFDEASQLSLPYACALGTLGKKLLFAGDPNQLAPIVVSQSSLLATSPFLFIGSGNCCQLDEQNRMAPEICHLVADMFYEGNLHVAKDSESDTLWNLDRRPNRYSAEVKSGLHVALCLTQGKFLTAGDSKGVYRQESVDLSVEIAQMCLERQSRKVAILTPFRKQRREIHKLLRRKGLNDVTVDTVHSAQGAEFDIVIFDPVLGDPVRLGGRLLSDEREGRRLLNVAISRAKAQFIVLLAPADCTGNKLLQQLADAIEIENTEEAMYVGIETVIGERNFPKFFENRFIYYQGRYGKLVDAKKEGYFAIAGKGGTRTSFAVDAARASFLKA